MLKAEIELEKKITETAVMRYQNTYNKNIQEGNFSNTKVANIIMERILIPFTKAVEEYTKETESGLPHRNTKAAKIISLIGIDKAAFISLRVILNGLTITKPVQSLYKQIGQALENEYKMYLFKNENKFYYNKIIEDMNKRNASGQRKYIVTNSVFNKRLDFHIDTWTISDKIITGLVLTDLCIESTGVLYYQKIFKKNKCFKYLQPTKELQTWIENVSERIEALEPVYLPMVCKPKEWTNVFEGGYISPYIRKNKLIKNNNREYLKVLSTAKMPIVYEAINHLQNTEWAINQPVLEIVKALWEEGKEIAGLPDREDIEITPFPYPDIEKEALTESQKLKIKQWKQQTYDTHKKNIQKRSIRILTAQIIRIAEQFKQYESIWFPHQMDFRGRLYPIPVLLQPQGSDLAKGLLRFSKGKKINDKNSEEWFYINGANLFGEDKICYKDRITWVLQHSEELKSYGQYPLQNRGWAEADKPLQFLAWCIEYNQYCTNRDNFYTYLPVQLDGTCNGLQHYSALLRDEVAGKSVNLINGSKPNDIYQDVAEKLKEKLYGIIDRNEQMAGDGANINVDRDMASRWLGIGINRKLTKRPVMTLPYGSTLLSCREYIQEYLLDNYSANKIWEMFQIGNNPADCVFKISCWLSKILWEAITDTLQSAVIGMDYIKSVMRVVNGTKNGVEWLTPVGLLVHQEYRSNKKRQIETELFGKIRKVRINDMTDVTDKQHQINGICPNFIHSIDAACLMLYLVKCKAKGINAFMTVHDCYGTYASDTEESARLLREAFVEIYQTPVLENFIIDISNGIEETDLPQAPDKKELDITSVLSSEYFFN